MGAPFQLQRGVGVAMPSASANTTPPRRGSGGYRRTIPVSSTIPARRLSAGVTGVGTVESVATAPRALSGTTAGAAEVSCLEAAGLLSTTSQPHIAAVKTTVSASLPQRRPTAGIAVTVDVSGLEWRVIVIRRGGFIESFLTRRTWRPWRAAVSCAKVRKGKEKAKSRCLRGRLNGAARASVYQLESEPPTHAFTTHRPCARRSVRAHRVRHGEPREHRRVERPRALREHEPRARRESAGRPRLEPAHVRRAFRRRRPSAGDGRGPVDRSTTPPGAHRRRGDRPVSLALCNALAELRGAVPPVPTGRRTSRRRAA